MSHWRVNFILVCIFLLGAIVVGRLVFLQIIEHDYYAALAKGQQITFESTEGDRGEIFFKDHDIPLATNKIYTFVYASPSEIPFEKKNETAEALSKTLGLSKDSLLEKFKRDSLFELIKDKISDEELGVLQEMDLAGIHLGEEKLRNYPYRDFASHILGFVNKDGQGQYGIEEYWQDVLAGKKEFLEGVWGPLGYLFSGRQASENRGADLFLTVDYNIQYLAEKLLKEAHDNLDAEGGTIIVMEPQSGRILALADWPNFDPNRYFEERDFEIFQTDAIQKIFEPGSVFKPITMAAALDKGKITPQTTYFDPGCYEIKGYKVCNYEERVYPGELTMTNVLEKSINTGAVFAESQVGHKAFLNYIERFGIFEKTGIDLWGEISSQNIEFRKGYEINFATASFGQGIEMTPFQIARAFCAIANGGKLVQPYLVEKVKKDSEVVETLPEIGRTVISPSTASKLTAMMVSVVENGFGRAAGIPGYYIAGKTGTAQISWSALDVNKKGYSDKTWQSFIGFAPAFDARFLILVKLNNPGTKTAEYSALPIFRTLAGYIIDYYQIPPDRE